ncbi:hypothetical protein [Xanthomonas sacchari]|uniref:Uncharacterized protein n=1 Tax=Xanthomonas sacchari TaxID=56458 RepID=A0AA46YAY3_9XANT|nr:hypothetical protein [Xanthomonas sacchari]UYK90538.1 hypothetical protein NG824_09180 [Xanthomonas sacchari]
MHTITSPRRAAFLLLLLLPATQADMTAAAAARAAPVEMTESDFAVSINNHSFALGERWSEQTRLYRHSAVFFWDVEDHHVAAQPL